MPADRTPTVFCLFGGIGGGALGFQQAGFRLLGSVDADEGACADYEYLTGSPATLADLTTMTPDELRAVTDGECPDVVFTSPPCKGYSGCLPTKRSKSKRYQQMNSLALRGIWLALEAWDDLPKLLLFENVPRIQSRGKQWLEEIQGLLRAYGYAVEMSTHDCGELGGLAQHRKRFLLVARHMEAVPEYLRVPASKRVRGIGEVLRELPLPLPGSKAGGRMHRLPKLAPKNWVRLALIPAGGDWRDLPGSVALPHRSGRQNGGFGLNDWEAPSHAVVAEGSVRNTWASVTDPRLGCSPRATVYGVVNWNGVSGAVIGNARHDNGAFVVADPRSVCKRREGALGVKGWEDTSTAVIAHGTVHNGNWQVADPRLPHVDGRHAGNLGVSDWDDPGHTVIGGGARRGWDSVSDPRDAQAELPEVDWESKKPVHLIIRAADGAWHRPMTTLELAALQGFPTQVDGEWLKLSGNADRRWRQRIGNAVPPPAARAIANNCRATLAASADGVFLMSAESIWVAPNRPAA